MTHPDTPQAQAPARPAPGARPPYGGVIAPLVTPLDAQGRVGVDDVARLIASIHTEVTALMPTLSSGEGWRLTEPQWGDMVSATVHHAAGLPVIAGVQLPDTGAVVARARLAAALGVDAIAVTTPFGAEVDQEDVVTHYRRVIEAGLPVFVYNEEALSGNRIEAETLVRICALPGVVGVKESSGDAAVTRRLVAANLGVPVFEGWENLLSQVPGVDGFIGPLANLEPALCAALWRRPTPQAQARVDAACQRYGILLDDWYLHVKRELVARGTIGSAVAAAGADPKTPVAPDSPATSGDAPPAAERSAAPGGAGHRAGAADSLERTP